MCICFCSTFPLCVWCVCVHVCVCVCVSVFLFNLVCMFLFNLLCVSDLERRLYLSKDKHNASRQEANIPSNRLADVFNVTHTVICCPDVK